MGCAVKRKDETITCKVKEYRQTNGLSQQELAERVDVRRQAIYDIEAGRYLPNTAIALRLARVFACRVEDLFVQDAVADSQTVDVIQGASTPATRLALGRIRERLVGFPLQGEESIGFGLRSADGILTGDGRNAKILSPADHLEKTIILMGCDPAFEILGSHVLRSAPEARVHCRFATSHRALTGLAEGMAHVAGTHFHNTGKKESNVVLAGKQLAGTGGVVFGFSLLEEGLMVARGNPLGIRSVADLAQGRVRFINRDQGAALRTLLDDNLNKRGIDNSAIRGYETEVHSHREGAFRIVCNVADAALGFRAVAEAYNIGFVPITSARCDLVIPNDLKNHPTVHILLDVLQSNSLRKEISSIPGYESSVTGNLISEV